MRSHVDRHGRGPKVMQRSTLPVLLICLCLGGWTNVPDHWYRAASGPEQRSMDEHACRERAAEGAQESSRVDASHLQDQSADDETSASILRPDITIAHDE